MPLAPLSKKLTKKQQQTQRAARRAGVPPARAVKLAKGKRPTFFAH